MIIFASWILLGVFLAYSIPIFLWHATLGLFLVMFSGFCLAFLDEKKGFGLVFWMAQH